MWFKEKYKETFLNLPFQSNAMPGTELPKPIGKS